MWGSGPSIRGAAGLPRRVPRATVPTQTPDPMVASQMVAAHPRPATDMTHLVECIEACFECAQACTSCADACLAETEHLQALTTCIRLNLDCADVCEATGRLATRQSSADDAVLSAQVQACAEACRACAEECERHAEMHEHCRVCAEACRRCEEACRQMVSMAA